MRIRNFILTVFVICLLLPNSHAQELGDLLSKYKETNGKLYMQPLADAFGTSFNSGLYHNAAIKQKGFQLYVGVSAMAAIVPNKLKTFQAKPEGLFVPEGDPNASYEAPTILGDPDGLTIDGVGGTSYTFPGGWNLDYVPFAVPQVTIGSLWGTNATFRFISYDAGEDIGKLEVFGWGIRHNLDQYLEMLPFNLAIGYYNQYFKVGDIVDANGSLINLQASIQKSIFTLYGGLGYETSSLDISYTYEGEDVEEEISFDLDGPKALRATLGVTFNLGPLKLNADYNLAKVNVFSAGIGFGIGDK